MSNEGGDGVYKKLIALAKDKNDVDKSLKLLWSFWPQPGWNSSWSKCSWWGSPKNASDDFSKKSN